MTIDTKLLDELLCDRDPGDVFSKDGLSMAPEYPAIWAP